jgi:NitT/TauT family transport system ATP-binding protein
MTGPALEVVGLAKGYEKNGRPVPVLDLERLAVQDGAFVTIAGRSGCCKNTLLHIMGGFIPADAGRILGSGRAVTGPGPDRGMVFQEFAPFPGRSVAGNVSWALEVQGRPYRNHIWDLIHGEAAP